MDDALEEDWRPLPASWVTTGKVLPLSGPPSLHLHEEDVALHNRMLIVSGFVVYLVSSCSPMEGSGSPSPGSQLKCL